MTLEFAKRKTVKVTNWSNPFDAQFVHGIKKMHLAPSARSTHSKLFLVDQEIRFLFTHGTVFLRDQSIRFSLMDR